jgi:hypothetical protein
MKRGLGKEGWKERGLEKERKKERKKGKERKGKERKEGRRCSLTPRLLAAQFLDTRAHRYSTHRGYYSQPTAVLVRVPFSPPLLPASAAAIGDLIVIAAPDAVDDLTPL